MTAAIDDLVRERNEIAGAHAGLGWNEQATGRRFEDRHLDHIALADPDERSGTRALTEGLEQRVGPEVGRGLDHFRADVDQGVVQDDGAAVP